MGEAERESPHVSMPVFFFFYVVRRSDVMGPERFIFFPPARHVYRHKTTVQGQTWLTKRLCAEGMPSILFFSSDNSFLFLVCEVLGLWSIGFCVLLDSWGIIVG